MAMAANDIERLIRARIPDAEVTIRDLAGDGDHYAATVISESFRGKSRVQQHQIVYHQTSCHGCRLQTCIAEARRCLTSITVAEMASAVARILGRPDEERALDVLQSDPAQKGESS